MTQFETLSLLIGGITALTILGGVIFTYRQVKLLVKTHADNHEWNRRLATQEILFSITSSDRNYEVVSRLLDQDRTTPIPKSELLKKFEEEPELEAKTQLMLNFFEALARGVKYGIYDEDIVRNARHGTMRRSVLIFREYIAHWRVQNYKYWIEMEELVQKWDTDESKSAGKAPIGSGRQ